ncbi:MAG: NAD(P)/FAD-dependent oxidoreductase [Lachnospiraceae bacterium]|nr:NAD(P)/FAD-dependent oxidoreductase [Lachnospiraceae bacterium]
MKKVFDTVVIGGGASGLIAAVFAARSGCRVLVLEQKEKLCKKIYATGNGKCNFTNKDWQPAYFRGSDYSFAEPVLCAFSLNDTLAFFKEIGVYPKERNGYFYPASEQAASVAENLVREAERLGVECLTGIKVGRVYCDKNKQVDGSVFVAETENGKFYGKSMVLATGGKASPAHGSDGSGYPFAKSFGHTVIPPLPAIVQLKAEGKFFKTLAGVRTDGRVTLHIGKDTYTEEGELLFAAYGLSGIPVMQVSRYASVALAKKQPVSAELDLFPALSEGDLAEEIARRFRMMKDSTAEEALAGLCNHKLNYVILQKCALEPTKKAGTYGKKDAALLAENIKHFTVKITDTNGYEQAQACTGGVPLSELTESMESKLVAGLFITGELADIDGTCGGYNLQWAWSSGAAAGKKIGGTYASHSAVETKH